MYGGDRVLDVRGDALATVLICEAASTRVPRLRSLGLDQHSMMQESERRGALPDSDRLPFPLPFLGPACRNSFSKRKKWRRRRR